VEFADIIEVTLTDGRKFRANKVGADPESDIAVLKIEASDLPTIEWADSEQAKVGDWVLAIGNPFDYLTSTVTAGIISAKGRDLEIAVRQGQQKFTNFIQTDAAVNPGNSGGALVDEQGRLLGINSAIATPTGVYAGYSFAIPVETVRSIVEEIFRQSSNRDFGFEVTALDDELADHLNLDVRRGIIILKTEAGSAAQFAGLRPFDVITRVNDIKVQTIEEIEEAFGKLSDDNVIELTVVRKGEKMRVPIKLKK
jgi:S1-C subfamily serine protease